MTALHATEASTVYLSLHARVAGVTVADIDDLLYEQRSLVKQLAMRRTLWAVPRDLLPALWGSASARVAEVEFRRLVKEVEKNEIARDGTTWLTTALDAVEGHLSGREAMGTRQIREQVAAVAGSVVRSPGKAYGGIGAIAPNVLTLLGAQGRAMRARNAGHWRSSRPLWGTTLDWLGEPMLSPLPARAGYARLVTDWLATFGPGTEADLVWWLGATKAAVRQALADVDAQPVLLEDGSGAWLAADDLQPEPPAEPWAALLPTLDPTTMGWRGRDFYLHPEHTRLLFDSVGNGGTSAWLDGRMVGAWIQDESGRVQIVPVAPLAAADRARLQEEATRLTDFLDGTIITNVYKSQLMRGVALP
nr:winged helix DNA-binding domain-containing protein [Kineosphaera limosa]